ncbi:hypothetical protein EVAR_56231_1 [Eumeta japonica]|uniref:Uncharacterized protein n=1 Tax=Eumeta variegata TaxID=151549 RepID=A0A4C1XHR7_EUMVA|nr:hypothetical protein EVAR_56231_1 [Eumeta japonica]
MSGRLLVGDTTLTAQVAMVPFQGDSLMIVLFRCRRRATRERARVIAHAQPTGGGGTRLDEHYSTIDYSSGCARSRPPPVRRQ